MIWQMYENFGYDAVNKMSNDEFFYGYAYLLEKSDEIENEVNKNKK